MRNLMKGSWLSKQLRVPIKHFSKLVFTVIGDCTYKALPQISRSIHHINGFDISKVQGIF